MGIKQIYTYSTMTLLFIILTPMCGFGADALLESLPVIFGEALSLTEINSGSNPARGHYIYSVSDKPGTCIAENVRDLSALPVELSEIPQILHGLSYKTGSFVEAGCWILILDDEVIDRECFSSSSPVAISGSELDPPLQSLLSRRRYELIKTAMLVHSHPPLTVYEQITGSVSRHLGPSNPDLLFHLKMETQFHENFRQFPIGSFLSIIHPLQSSGPTEFFYYARTFLTAETCPKNPDE